MPNAKTWQVVRIALCSATLIIAGCAINTEKALTSNKETGMTSQIIHPSTHCFGRYLIDIPNNFKFRQRYAHRAGDINLIPNLDQDSFNELVKQRENEMKGKSKNTDLSWYVDTIKNGATQKIVRFYKEGPSEYITDLDGYVLAGSTAYKFNSRTGTSKLDAGTQWVTDTLARVRARSLNEIPTTSGFCIDGGFIQGNDNVYESVTVSMAPDNQPAVRISFNTSTPNAVAPGLLAREDAVKGFFRNFTKLRRGKKIINGIEGEESLLSSINDQGDVIHYFTWDSYHGSAENRRPAISFEMAAGGPSNKMASPYSDGEAIKLWDSITTTLRLRPGAF